MVKNLPETWEAWVWSLAWEDALEKAGMKYFSSPIEDRKCISETVLSFYFLGICLKVIVSYLIVNLIVTFKREGISSVRFSSVPQSCPTGCNPIYCSMPGLPVHHQLPEFTQAHDHWISDAIQPYHPLLSPSPLPINLSFQMSQLFVSSGQSIGVSASTSALPMNIQDWFPLGLICWISLLSKGLSRVFSNTTVQKHQFFGAQLSSQSNSHIHTWLLEKT